MDDSTLRRAILTADIGTLRAYLQGGGYPSAISYDEKRERHISLLELALDARDKREQMLEILLSAGANPYSPSVWVSNRSSTVIDLARDCGEIELADLIERLASLDFHGTLFA